MSDQADFEAWQDALTIAIYGANLLRFLSEKSEEQDERYRHVRQSDKFEIRHCPHLQRHQAFAKRDIARGEQITKEVPVVRCIEHIRWLEYELRLMSLVLSLRLPRTGDDGREPAHLRESLAVVLRMLGH